MDKVRETKPYSYIILLVAFLNLAIINYLIFQIGGLANDLSKSLNLHPSQLAMLFSIPMLTSAIMGIPSGALADRFGAKIAISIGLIITVIGSFARISATSFGVMLVFNLLIGFGQAAINANAAKLFIAWFKPQQMTAVMGIFIAGVGVGGTAALATAPLFSSMQSAFTTSAILMACSVAFWLVLVRSKPAGAPTIPYHPVKEYLAIVIKSKHVWLGAIAIFFMMGSMVAANSFITRGYIVAKGVNPVEAGLLAACFTLAFSAGGILGPILSNKAGLMKPFMAPFAICASIAAYLAWVIPFGPLTWVLIVITGILLGTPVPIIMNLPILLPEIGPVYAGSAGGIINTLQMAGAFILPSFIIMPLAGTNIDNVFLFVSVGYIIFAIVMTLLPELGLKAKAK